MPRRSPQATESGHLIAAAPREPAGPQILAPILAGLSPALADLAAALPIGDANGMLLAEVDRIGEPPDNTVAGVFANDPFRSMDTLLAELSRRGVRAITNWPSVGPLGGELAAAYHHSGMTLEVELDCLARARDMGMSGFALVTGVESAQAALDRGIANLIVAPGLAVPDPAGRRDAARDATRLVEELASPGNCWLYAHPDFADWPGDAAAHARGLIFWDMERDACAGEAASALQSRP